MPPPASDSAYHRGFSPGRLHVAGIVTAAAWGFLAWRSHMPDAALGRMLVAVAIAWLAVGWAWTRVTDRNAGEILFFALLFRLIAFFASPAMEDDYYRFLWDGYRFAETGDPYAEPPQARFADTSIRPEFRSVLDHVNHPDVPTIYGPLSEWGFRLSYTIAPGRLWPWKLILLGAELGLFALLWSDLAVRGRLLLTWCPLAVFETGFNAHPDALAITLVVAAWWLGRRSRPLATGIAAGLAVAAKVFAFPLLPFLLWRQRHRAWAISVLVVIVMYTPFWWHGNAADFSGLRAMASEWEFNSSLFAIAVIFVSREIAHVGCALVFVAVWLVLFANWARSPSRARALPPGEWIYGAFLLLSATANPWYCLWLLPFIATRISATGLCALAAVSLSYITGLNLGDSLLGPFDHPIWVRPLEFGLIACSALVSSVPTESPPVRKAHGRATPLD